MKITKIFAFMLAMSCMTISLASCSDDEKVNTGGDTTNPDEVIPPLEYFTLNVATSSGLIPGISNVEIEDSVLELDLFMSANGEQILSSPVAAMMVEDKFVVACGDSFSTPNGVIEVLNPETLVRERRIEFEKLAISSFVQIDDNKILVVGSDKSKGESKNVVVVDIATGEKEEILLTDFNIQYAASADDKILIYGTIPGGFDMVNFVPIPESYHFRIFDKGDISEAGMRTVLEDQKAYAASSIMKFLSDDDNIWLPLENSDGSANLSCFDADTETIVATADIPNTSSIENNNFSLTMSNDEDFIYIRVAEAIYDYSVEANVINPDPMVTFNYSAGKLRDLEMTHDGKFLFIDQDGDIAGGHVFEVSKGDDGVWTKSEEGVLFEGIAPNDIIIK